MSKTVKQNRPAAKPGTKCTHGKLWKFPNGEPIQIRPDVVKGIERVADELNLPTGVLVMIVLDAFIALVDEDHGIHFPLMLQQVETV